MCYISLKYNFILLYDFSQLSEEEIYEDADEEGEYNVIDEAPRIDGEWVDH